jgi:hypothetical protein
MTMIAIALASDTAARPARYTNAKYGFSVALPARAEICGPLPPQPNHGVLFRPPASDNPPCDGDIEDGARYTEASAYFAPDGRESPAVLARRTCPEFAFGSQGHVTIHLPVAHPARLAWAGCRITAADGSIEQVLLAQRTRSGGSPPIDYVLTLKTDAAHFAIDRAAFRRWLASVRLPRPE